MWFMKAVGEFENGQQMPVIADLGGNFVHATAFFNYFSAAPIFSTFDLVLSKHQTSLEDILNAISKKEETKEDFTTA